MIIIGETMTSTFDKLQLFRPSGHVRPDTPLPTTPPPTPANPISSLPPGLSTGVFPVWTSVTDDLSDVLYLFV